MNCAGCRKNISNRSFLTCKECSSPYHFECLNLKADQYASLTNEFRKSWSCPSCSNVTRRHRTNPDTPVRQHQVPEADASMNMSCDRLDNNLLGTSVISPPNVFTAENFNQLLAALNVWRDEINSNISFIRDDIRSTMCEIQAEIKTIRSEQSTINQSVSSLRSELISLQTSVQFHSDEQNDLKHRVDELVRASRDEFTAAHSALQTKIDIMEQDARQCNIEISNLPERRNESLPSIVEAISSAIRVQVSHNDIVALHRVPHAHQGSDRPKNIILKLTTRIQRDNMLAAFRKIKSLNSEQLGIAGTSRTVYMNEHLTLKNKQLFRKCRDLARELRFKYVWIKNGTILVRESEDSPVFAIKTEKDLAKLKPKPVN